MLKRLKRIGAFLSSMRFGVALLVFLALACALGSFLPQGHTLDWYLGRYPARSAALLYGLGLDDVYHSPWFLALAVILCCNLLLCNLLHLPDLIRRYRRAADPDAFAVFPDVTLQGVSSPHEIFARMRMPKPAESEREGRKYLFSVKNRIGAWGSWVCHLGILLLIIGFTLGQVTKTEYTVYGVPGQTKKVEGSDLTVTIDSFDVGRTGAGDVTQFTTGLTMRRGGETESGTASVNAPASLLGYRVYQNSTGPAAKLTVSMDGRVQQEEVVCVGDTVSVLNTPLLLTLESYEPEYFNMGDGRVLPGFASSTSYMGQPDQAGVQVAGDIALRYGTVEISFSDPQDYTLLQIKQDRFTGLVLLGGLVTLLGLVLAFYLQTSRMWASEEGEGKWTVYGAARNGGAIFADRVREAAGMPSDHQKESR